MKKLTGALILTVVSSVLLTGCVPVTYTKTMIVHKNGDGSVAWTEERERHHRTSSGNTKDKSGEKLVGL